MTRADMLAQLEKFMEKVSPEPNTGCWLWTGAGNSDGYGRIMIATKRDTAHRFAWVMFRGGIAAGLCVCHRCDNPPCVNPDHLFLGTHSENMADMTAKGRRVSLPGDQNPARRHPEKLARGDRNGARLHPERIARGDNHPARLHPEKMRRGEGHWKAMLTEEKVREIRRLAMSGMRQCDIGAMFGVKQAAISNVIRGKVWRHVK